LKIKAQKGEMPDRELEKLVHGVSAGSEAFPPLILRASKSVRIFKPLSDWFAVQPNASVLEALPNL
jgi:hypothetical protein